mgnify:CR=1 FL=1
MNLYIHGTGIVSPAGCSHEADFLNSSSDYNTDRLLCKEPNYTAYIPPMQLRRMSKAVRMGIGATHICLQDADIQKPDAISVGTAFGCLHDTEVFLSKLIDQEEQMLTPTAFIQSTHNTVAGQIALLSGCYGHNLTFVHRGHSFEHAMINAQLYLDQHPQQTMLVGGIEELTPTSMEVLKETRVYRKEHSTPDTIVNRYAEGSIGGEGAAFFAISQRPQTQGIQIKDIDTFTTRDTEEALKRVEYFLDRNILVQSADLVLLGVNGDHRTELFYTTLRTQTFKDIPQAGFKHLCGEYPVAGSFALGLAMHMFKQGLPQSAVLNHPPKSFRNIVLVNNFLHHYSCWYLSTA